MPFTFWPSLMLGLNIDLERASYVMGVVGLSDMFGRIMLGRLVDRYFITLTTFNIRGAISTLFEKRLFISIKLNKQLFLAQTSVRL